MVRISETRTFGEKLFSENIMKERLSNATWEAFCAARRGSAPLSSDAAQEIASVMKDWAIALGATHFTHWFQPLNEVTAGKHDAFLSPGEDGCAVMEFSGKELVRGEPDASSFPSGGLRATFEARGYTAWDLTSPAFVLDRTLYIPSVFCSYTGEALDKKTPLLRSMDAVGRAALSVLRALGDTETKSVTPMVGPEQEYFLVDRELYEKRMDLMICGRTLFGSKPPKGQELDDHYCGRLRLRVSAFMHELDEELWALGVFAKTKHNEVAPAQHELAVVYSTANIACDHNHLVMETMRRVAKRHSLACLLHEKPFAGVSGSGKHVNWSLTTDTGKNFFKPGCEPENNPLFLVSMAALMRGVDEYQDLIRYSCANVGNDDRLGAAEAPPSIVSLYLGEALSGIFTSLAAGQDAVHKDETHLGLTPSLDFTRDTTDRNRTSPCAFTGNKVEFRMCGSSASVSRPCFIINTIMAEELSYVASRLNELEGDVMSRVRTVVAEIARTHGRILFDGDNYSEEWHKEALRRGLANITSTVEAIGCALSEKNVKLFEKHGILTAQETKSRAEVQYDLYSKVRNIESLIMIEMAGRNIIPAVMDYCGTLARDVKNLLAISCDAGDYKTILDFLLSLVHEAKVALSALEREHEAAMQISDEKERAEAYRDRVVVQMDALRTACDKLEEHVPDKLWPHPTYLDLMYRV
ncbi:MAG: glutamine synthetase III [Clostridia bacterium]|nr:glutamine synthetase III [Clostridia bacterium]